MGGHHIALVSRVSVTYLNTISLLSEDTALSIASAYVARTIMAVSIQSCSSAITIFSIKQPLMYYILLFYSAVGGKKKKKKEKSSGARLSIWPAGPLTAPVFVLPELPRSCQRKPLTEERQLSALASPHSSSTQLPSRVTRLLHEPGRADSTVTGEEQTEERALRGRRESAPGDSAAAGTGGPAEPPEPAHAGQRHSARSAQGHRHTLRPTSGCVTTAALRRALAVIRTRRVQDCMCRQPSRHK